MFGEKKIMRRVLAVMLAVLIVLVITACGKTAEKDETSQQEELPEAQQEETDTSSSGTMLEVWTHPDSPDITDELSSLFNKATEGLIGAGYTPVACIGRQVVSGMNYAFICREKIISPGTPETYSIVYIYEDTEGNAEIKNIMNTGVKTWMSDSDTPTAGGWKQADSPEISDKLGGLLDSAFEGLLGADYSPVALLSTQVVAGMNYCVLCEQKVVYPGAEPEYVFVYLYEDLDGNSQITDIVHIADDAADAQ